MRTKSKKVIETEKWVDEYIDKHGHPPTYEILKENFKLKSKGVAYARCAKFREKMVRHPAVKMKEEKLTCVRIDFVVPASKFNQFTELTKQINNLLSEK